MRNRPPAHDLTDASRGERLQRVLADAGVGSRRACEEMVLAGEVEVNGVVVTELPAWVDPDEDRIVVQGRPVPRPERKLYVLLNKPTRTLSTAKDEPGADRRTVLDLVDHPGASHLFPVGRLDYDTVGLILLTNDGELANRLTHPRYGVPKTYRVQVKGTLGEEAVKELEQGIYLAERKAGQTVGGVRTAHVEISILSQDREGTTLEMTLREGRNRQVRRMLAAVGYPVRKLERTGMGPIRLKGVARGAWRELTRDEVWALKRAAADSRPDAAGDADAGEGGGDAPKRRTRASAAKKAGVKAGGKKAGVKKAGAGSKRAAYEAPALNAGAPIKRRTMKNAINRATGLPAGERPRRGDDADEGALTKPEAKPGAKPVRKPAGAKPGSARGGAGGRSATKPGGKPGKKPSDWSTERPAAPSRGAANAKPAGGRPTGKATGKATGKPAGKPTGKPAGKPVGKPAGKPTGRSGAKPGGKPSGGPKGRPGGRSGGNASRGGGRS